MKEDVLTQINNAGLSHKEINTLLGWTNDVHTKFKRLEARLEHDKHRWARIQNPNEEQCECHRCNYLRNHMEDVLAEFEEAKKVYQTLCNARTKLKFMLNH